MSDKVTKSYAHYTNHAEEGEGKCIDCTMWRKGFCSYVEGKIVAEGHCRFFKQGAKDVKNEELLPAKILKKAKSIKLKIKLKEDAPTNAVGSGNMAGGGNMSGFSPLLFKHKKFKRSRHKLRRFGDK